MSAAGDFCRQFLVLAWKNRVLKLRAYGTLILELAVPTIIILLIGVLSAQLPARKTSEIVPDSANSIATFSYDNPNNLYTGASACGVYGNLIWNCGEPVQNCSTYLYNETSQTFGPTQSFSEQLKAYSKCQQKGIAVAPEDPSSSAQVTAAENFVTWANNLLVQNGINLTTFYLFSSETAFLSYIESSTYSLSTGGRVYSAGVIFSGGYPTWNYVVRLNRTYFSDSPDDYSSPDTDASNLDLRVKTSKQATAIFGEPYLDAYNNNGFLSLANLVNSFIATTTCLQSGKCKDSDSFVGIRALGTVGFPSPKVSLSAFWGSIGFVFALLMILSLLYPIANVIRALVQEKESKMKEGMMMMALRGDVHYLSWIVHFMCLFLPLSVILTLAGQTLFLYSDAAYIWLYFLLFFMSATSYSFLVAKLFNRSLTAAIVGCIIFFMGFFIWVGLQIGAKQPSRSSALAAMLHPACAFTYGTLAFAEYEGAQIGVTSKTWDKSELYPVNFRDCIDFMFIDTIWMAVLSWYIGKVWPSEFGTHLPWYFLLTPTYWLGIWRDVVGDVNYADNKVHNEVNIGEEGGVELMMMMKAKAPVEAVTETLAAQVDGHKCVDIRNLYKEFNTASGKKVAVDGLSLTMYSGQITTLLGHNGAGKSTAISVMTGLLAPDGGTVVIEGLDIRTDLAAIRRHLGVCPQHDVLFPDLTVEEHLILFASFKGIKGANLKEEVQQMIEAVGLTEKKTTFAKQLSGGQKRKLSVGIAFIGGSRVVFLDEPTSGMDPYSRRFTWNVIKQHRENRIIVLTTHFMDEADLLGDRIAIMGDGKLKCAGSSLFLKSTYGVGYNMTLEKLNATEFNAGRLKDVINSHVPEAKLLTDAGTEITFQLPFQSSQSFPPLFNYIDENDTSLGIRSYGVSVTTLEEVFIRVAQGTDTQALQDKAQKELMEANQEIVSEEDVEGQMKGYPLTAFTKIDDNDRFAFFLRHVHAIFLKRMMYFSRDTKSWIFHYGLPLLIVLIGMIIQNVTSYITNQPLKVLNTALYNGGINTDFFPAVYNQDPAISASSCNWVENINDYIFTYPCSDNQLNLLSNIPQSANYPLIAAKNATGIYNVSAEIYKQRNSFEASQIGAFSIAFLANYSNQSTSTVYVDYNIHGNYSALHAGPLYQALMADAVVHSIDPAASVTVSVYPLPYTSLEKSYLTTFNVDLIVTFIALAIPWLAASYASYVVREREMKSKHQQMVSGMSVHAYWIGTWLWDFVAYQPTLWGIVILVCAFPDSGPFSSVSSGGLGLFIGLSILFGTSISGFVYFTSFFFKTPSGAQIITVFLILVLGFILGIVGIVLRLIVADTFLNHLLYLFALVPTYAYIGALHNMAGIKIYSVSELGGTNEYQLSDFKITGFGLAFMGWETVFFMTIVIVYEYLSTIPRIKEIVMGSTSLPPPDKSLRDTDVLEEENRVMTDAANESSTILVKDLKKMYPGGKYAVRGVSLGIPNGECFGLLGINGAGKTSFLSMLSCEFKPTAGEAYLGGLNLLTDVHNCRKRIGFCPQFDALFDMLTGREHLELYARIKGIAEADISKVVDVKLKEMGLVEYAARSAYQYSGGNKRKLSLAIAMIGEPSIVFLDEPSTGMDPVARRFMWQVITDIVTKREKCSLILTTHSMEECEALCTRIGIMVGGVLRCLGSSQRLRSVYGHGYQIEIGIALPSNEQVHETMIKIVQAAGIEEQTKTEQTDFFLNRQQLDKAIETLGYAHWKERLTGNGSGSELLVSLPRLSARQFASWWIIEDAYDKICAFLTETFGNYVLRERQLSKIRIEISSVEASVGGEGEIKRKLGTLFGAIESRKMELCIQDYSIAQTSLEQIFNQFAAQQEEETGHAAGIQPL